MGEDPPAIDDHAAPSPWPRSMRIVLDNLSDPLAIILGGDGHIVVVG
jgi:hypothetical protein